MIPKIIHLCWLSGDAFPNKIAKCIDSWKRIMPDYEIVLWDTKRFDLNQSLWVKQAFEKKKYAFAADYIRFYALYTMGGIYLDSDVEVLKRFDDFLDLPYFIGAEKAGTPEAAIIGAEKGCKWVKDILDTYQDKTFIKEDGTYDMLPLPCRFHHILTGLNYKFHLIHKIVNYEAVEKQMYVFDCDFFNSRNAIEVRQTPKSYCAHNYAGGWSKTKNPSKSVKDYLPKWLLKSIYTIGQKTWARKKYAWFQIPFEK